MVALGYIDAPDEDTDKTVQETIESNRLNLANLTYDANQLDVTLEILNSCELPFQESLTVKLLKAACYLGMSQRKQAKEILEPLQDGERTPPRVDMMLGTLAFAEGHSDIALEHLARVQAAEPRLPGLHVKLGEVFTERNEFELAGDAFEKALEIDAESPAALAGLARVKLESGDAQGALDCGLIAAELVHYYPRVHYVIGKALAALGDRQGAMEALELTVKQAPRFSKAHQELATLYRETGRFQEAKDAEMYATGILKYQPK